MQIVMQLSTERNKKLNQRLQIQIQLPIPILLSSHFMKFFLNFIDKEKTQNDEKVNFRLLKDLRLTVALSLNFSTLLFAS
jgi:NADPH-dependent 7-cyano-7-deazaguanine reductase QueF-like protein